MEDFKIFNKNFRNFTQKCFDKLGKISFCQPNQFPFCMPMLTVLDCFVKTKRIYVQAKSRESVLKRDI